MPKFKVNDVVQNGKGQLRTIKEVYSDGYRSEYEDGGCYYNSLAYAESAWTLFSPDPKVGYVDVDSDGFAQFPDWVKPGYYKATEKADGVIVLEPLMTRSEWEAFQTTK